VSAVARAGSTGDLADRVRAAAASLFGGPGTLARVAGDEIALLAYAGAGPWLRPREGPERFSHQRELARGSMVAAFVLLIVLEGGAIHAALVHAHPRIAWPLAALNLWSLLWLLGDYQALRVRRSSIGHGVLSLRVGLRASAEVQLSDIVAVRACTWSSRPAGPGLLNAFPKPAEPTLLLELAAPVAAERLYAPSRRYDRIALAPDERARFLAALVAAGVAVETT
jgi:hypothetical protein